MLKKARKLRKIASSIIVALLFLSLSVSAFNVHPAKAQSGGTIYINSNGSITPATANITTRDNVTYTFTGNNYLPIVVQRTDITIDGAGYKLSGSGSGNGIYLSLRLGYVTIKNTTITKFYDGVLLNSSDANAVWGDNITNNSVGIELSRSSSVIRGNNITNNWIGIELYHSNSAISGNFISKNRHDGLELESSANNNAISGNNITNNDNDGIELESSANNNAISGNNITNNDNDGIELESSANNNAISGNNIANTSYGYDIRLTSSLNATINGNNIKNSNKYGIYLDSSFDCNVSRNMFTNDGLEVWESFHNIVRDNLVNGRPLVYLENASDQAVSDAGQVVLVKCDRIVVSNSNLSYTPIGVEIWQTNNTRITNINVTNSYNGVYLQNSTHCILTGNIGDISLQFSNDNQIANNSASSISLSTSDSNIIENNHNCSIFITDGAFITLPYYGLQPFYTPFPSENNTVEGNNATSIEIYDSHNNTVRDNLVAGPFSSDIWTETDGITLTEAYNNTIGYNVVKGYSVGIKMGASWPSTNNNTFIYNVVSNNTVGILSSGENNIFKENAFTDNWFNFGGTGLIGNNVDTSNTVNGKPVYVVVGQDNLTINPSTYPSIGYLALANCTNAIIENLTLTGNCDGLLLYDTRNVTVTDCLMTKNIIGLEIDGLLNQIVNNTISNNLHGLTIAAEGNDTVSDNTISDNTYRNLAPQDPRFAEGFGPPSYLYVGLDTELFSGDSGGCLILSGNNTFISNTIINNERGLILEGGRNTFKNNQLSQNRFNIALDYFPGRDDLLIQNMDSSNTVEGRPLYYWTNQHNTQVPEGAGFVVLINCTNIVVKDANVTRNRMGIVLVGTRDTTITNTTITGCVYGIYLYGSNNADTITNCTMTYNGAGIAMYYVNQTTINHNILSKNMMGVWLIGSNDTIQGNMITNNTVPGSGSPWPFPELEGPEPLYRGDRGGGIDIDSGFFNIVKENTIAYNILGLSIGNPTVGGAGGNVVYHNNFINNTNQALCGGIMDNGYPSGGNYWSSYNGTDLFSGPYQNLTGSDGIGDTPYATSWYGRALGTDRYPLMAPFKSANVTWNNQQFSVDLISNSSISNLSFNATTKTLSFNVTGTSGTVGFCRVAIPLSLMSGGWTVTVNGTPVSYSTTIDSNYTYIYFTYHHSTETVQITSTSAVPELPPLILLPLFMIITLLGVIILKRKRNVKK